MTAIWIAVGAVTAIGILCALLLVIASKFMAVEEDERFPLVRDCLPGANCGACGYPGCDGYARALLSGKCKKTNLCVPGADSVARQLSDLLQLEFEDVEEKVAVIRCQGDCTITSIKADYVGLQTCQAAKLFYGGGGSCAVGCLGFGDCTLACPHDAICIENGIAHIDHRRCVGCGLCTKACPQKVIELRPDGWSTIVACRNQERGADIRKKCELGCIGCRMCETECPADAIRVKDNLARIDYSLCVDCGHCVDMCPVGSITFSENRGAHSRAKDQEE